jgi:hypothetical protein
LGYGGGIPILPIYCLFLLLDGRNVHGSTPGMRLAAGRIAWYMASEENQAMSVMNRKVVVGLKIGLPLLPVAVR